MSYFNHTKKDGLQDIYNVRNHHILINQKTQFTMKLRNWFAILFFMMAFSSVKAQLSVGPGISFPVDLGDLGILARGTYQIDDTWGAQATFTYYLDGVEGVSIWSIDGDATYNFTESDVALIYALAGVSFFSAGVDLGPFGNATSTDFGVSLGGGAKFSVSDSFTPFGEVRLRIAGGTDLVLSGGVLFDIN
jgi:opacity protein-like surface antigen